MSIVNKSEFSQLDNEDHTFENDMDTAQDISLKRPGQTKSSSPSKLPIKKILLLCSVLIIIALGYVIATRPKERVWINLTRMKYIPTDLGDPVNEIYPPEKQRDNFPKFQPVPTFAVDIRNKILCNLTSSYTNAHCQSNYIVDSLDLLYIVCPIYSFGRAYDTWLYELHVNFQHYMKSIGIPFITFEAVKSYTDEEYILTKPNNEPYEMQGYYNNISYIRENLLNVAIQRIKVDWEYVAWIDAHQVLENIFWWEEAIHKAEHYAAVQLFSDSIRLDNQNKTTIFRAGFIKTSFFMQDINKVDVQLEFGNAHILTRNYYEKIGYIHDECFATGCDWAYLQAALPKGSFYLLEPGFPHYNSTHQDWLFRTKPIFHGSRAYVSGNIYHLDHMSTFSYAGLRAVVEKSDYDFKRDVHKDENGVFYLSNVGLAKKIEKYFYDNL